MKHFLLLTILISTLGCKKDNDYPSLIGKWTIIQTNAGTGNGFVTQNYSPGVDMTIDFKADGTFLLSGLNPGVARSPLWKFDKYLLQSDNAILFYDTITSEEMPTTFEIENGLSLWYNFARCGYEEKFIRR